MADTTGQAELSCWVSESVDEGVGTGHTGGGYCGQDDEEQVGAHSTFKNGLLLLSEYSRP